MVSKIFVGGDVSKGYADFCFLNESGSELPQSARYDDTASGHGKLVSALKHLGKDRSVALLVGVEASGGYEENWLGGLLKLAESGLDVTAYRFNPLVIKRYCDTKLHRPVNDAQAARNIACFLSQAGKRELGSPVKTGVRSEKRLYRSIVKQVQRLAELKVDLLLAVSTNHPELVQYLTTKTPDWLLRLLTKWPTARKLASAKPETLAQIKGITLERAIGLVNEAKSSVGCSMAKSDELTLQMLAGEVRDLQVKIKRWKAQLEEIMAEDPAVIILQSIPGVALWSAIAIRLEIGDFADFSRAAKLVAYSGLDPTPKSSGDGHSPGSISKCGSSNLRAVLFMCAFVACTNKIEDPSKKTDEDTSEKGEEALVNRVFRSFYQRLRARGKSHKFALTACMGKMLRIAHSCVRNGELYSADRHESQMGKTKTVAPDPNPGLPPASMEAPDLAAPVSKKEKKKRATAVPQENKGSRKGGPGIALAHPS